MFLLCAHEGSDQIEEMITSVQSEEGSYLAKNEMWFHRCKEGKREEEKILIKLKEQ